MSESHPRPGTGWEDLLDEACRRASPESGSPHSIRRSLSILSETEREELDHHLSATLKEDESEAMADCLLQLEDVLADHPHALELLEHVRQDIARTALRCIEHSYRFGKRRGQREALDMLIPYIRDLSPSL
jgi:hypothetical protein